MIFAYVPIPARPSIARVESRTWTGFEKKSA